MITKLLSKILGTANERQLHRMEPVVEKINALEPAMVALTDDELTAKTNEFRARLTQGETFRLPIARSICCCS